MVHPIPPRAPPGRCSHCWLRRSVCICATLTPHSCPTELVLLRHWREARKSSNTGRIAHLVLPDLRVFDYGEPGARFDPSKLGAHGAHLLLPHTDGEEGSNIDVDPSQIQRLIIPDGTWGQSRRMCHRLGLSQLPRLRLPPPPPSALRLRRAPSPSAMSTLEAIASAVRLLGSPETSQALSDAHQAFVKASLSQRGIQPPESS